MRVKHHHTFLFTASLLSASVAATGVTLNHALGQDRDTPRLYTISVDRGKSGGGLLYLADGRLLVYVGHSSKHDPPLPQLESQSKLFEVSATDKGSTLRARPRAWEAARQTAKTLDYEGWYVTADYSTEPPTVKLTKEPEKGSYWKLFVGNEPIASAREGVSPAYLSTGDVPIYFSNARSHEDLEYREVRLSPDKTDRFEFDKFNRDEIAK